MKHDPDTARVFIVSSPGRSVSIVSKNEQNPSQVIIVLGTPEAGKQGPALGRMLLLLLAAHLCNSVTQER